MLRHIASRVASAPSTPKYVCLFCTARKPVNATRLYTTSTPARAVFDTVRSDSAHAKEETASNKSGSKSGSGYKGRKPRKDGKEEKEGLSRNDFRKLEKKEKRKFYQEEGKKKLDLMDAAMKRGDVGKPAPKPPKSQLLEATQRKRREAKQKEAQKTKILVGAERLATEDLGLEPIVVEGQRAVPRLSHGLDRVIFSGGVYQLQDPRTKVYNFDPYLQDILPVTDFDFDAVGRYITSSKDNTLTGLAKKLEKKYIGSTSSMSGVLSHFHYLISNWRPLNLGMLSADFPVQSKTFTRFTRAPNAIFLRYKEEEGVYAIDADKEFDTDSVLSLLGRSMEKLLTIPPEKFEHYKKENSHVLTEEDRNVPDTYNYTTLGDFLMRSQLDAYDPRLPGTGMFDLKTRACAGVRADVENFHMYSGYQINRQKGAWFSYEREYYDMIRAAFMKYTLQARMGRMDGMFVAFHNTERIFGFQYVPLSEMDAAIHGTPEVGDGEFKLSVKLLGDILSLATERYPKTSLRLHFETREIANPEMQVFIEPMTEEAILEIQDKKRQDIENFLEQVALKNREAEVVFGKRPSERRSESASEESVKQDEEKVLATVKETNRLVEEKMLADRQAFKDEFTAEMEENVTSDLLALTVTTKSLINGKAVPRVHALAPHDKWELEYQIKESTDLDDAWRKYRNCKKKRREAGLASNLTPSEKEYNFYLKQMRKLSEQGRRMLNESLDKDTGEKVVWKHEEHNSSEV